MGAIVAPSGTWDVSLANWPYPQVRFLNYYTIGLAIDGADLKLYEMEVDSGSWNAVEVRNLGPVANVGNVELVDFGKFYVASVYNAETNTVACYTRDTSLAAGETDALALMDNTKIPNFITGCNYFGQAVLGGIDSPDPTWNDLYRHSIAWSGVGTFDFRIDKVTTAGYAHTSEGQGGDGIVWKVRQLGTKLMCYGSNGVYTMTPISAPASGWTSPLNLNHLPPLHVNAIAGSMGEHYYIDINLDLWRLTAEGVDKLSYKEFLQTLTASDIIMVYEEKRNRLYISDGRKSYVLTNKGMYECHQCVTSIGYNRQTLGGFFLDTEDYRGSLVTNTFDFFSRGFKSIQGLELGMHAEEDVRAFINYGSNGSALTASVMKKVTPDGFVAPIIAGVDLQIGIEVEDYRTANFSLDYMNAKIKYVDRRFRRGSYGISETNGAPSS